MDLEIERKKLLIEFDILDTKTEEMFDNITEIASKICETPIAMITLIDDKKQFFKSKIGINTYRTSIEHSFCKVAIEKSDKIFIVEDATIDERFKKNPMVVGSPNIVSYYGVPLVSKSGIAYGTLCVFDNQINTLSENQIEILIRLAKTVENLINLRSKSKFLDAYQLKIERYSKNMEDFTYMAVHDLKAPLRGIDSFVKMLEKKHKEIWDEKDEKYISFILQSTTKMFNLIQDLLEYSKRTTDKSNFEEFDLKALIDDIFDNTTFEIKHKNPILTCQEMPILFSSKIAFTVIFNNLINNGLKYQPDNQIPKIDIKSIKDEMNWIFTISDNGIGIESDYFDEIFKPLTRLHGNSKYEGTGLGLAICKKIIEDLNGHITVDSVLGEGTTFTLKIPKN
ncbi:MAG: GAF domain-containing protein [Flavobacteriia bacterium]|nr:GAF domain-containing protein [Flavobacteriia bacterium]OIP46762.1 MAG: hypothetical protein AUK46_08000 [Flavobacteriaceae bacterium CG2_30_31_66]PIV95818.1 MAG: bacteriophytochrome-like protein [Flavobacteriaceae bacterium CG17_big_fil_post_rev_8_21_14_2_50_31_13]PIX14534.1 MAG: bacteriophytochrome-like protein [Flavobacteriaceae bacterium CG_4_8_14_3_um_filter_31_8]PIY16113.1 MAG: bacteriophytochrome-like protein [Flavobacteriaceae bacterium CG_4_10_14_3_um_filter_31_253]PIZ11333.1 MAG: 